MGSRRNTSRPQGPTDGLTLSRGGLWVPHHLAPSGEQNTAEALYEQTSALVVGWTSLGFKWPTLGEAVDRIRMYGLVEALGHISRISIGIVRRRRDTNDQTLRAQQDSVLHGILGAQAAERIRAEVAANEPDIRDGRTDNRVFFHERQLLTAAKLALLHIDEDTPASGASLIPLCEALLMINELLDESLENMDTSLDVSKQRLAAHELASALFYRDSSKAQDYVRTYHEFVEPPEVLSSPEHFDIRGGLTRATGLSPMDVQAAVFAIQSDWMTLSDEDIAAGRFLHGRETFLLPLDKLSEEDKRKWYALSVTSVADLQASVRERYGADLSNWDFLPFELTPLVSVEDKLMCLSPRLLSHLGTTSLYYRILTEASRASSDGRASNLFQITCGKADEIYATRMLQRIFGDRCIPEEKLTRLPRAAGTKLCDAVVDYGDAVILFEVKGGRVPLQARNAQGHDAFLKCWKIALGRAPEQLRSFAQRIRDDGLASIGVDARRVRRIFPVVVYFDHIALPVTYERIQEEILKGTAFQGAVNAGILERLTIMNVRDLESLEALAEQGVSVLDEIQGALSVSDRFVAPMAMYLQRPGLPSRTRLSRWHEEEHDRIAALRNARLRELGLKETPREE